MMNATEHKMNKTWDQMTLLEQYACIYWDMYKDAYGVRPRGIDTRDWTEEDYRIRIGFLEKVIQEDL